MLDPFKRDITYLRVSVTDRCNLRCSYCMPKGGVTLIPRDEILSLEEIAEVVETGANLGIKKVRLTGGEPLVRKGIVHLVSLITQIRDINEVTMTTNGILLKKFAKPLKEAGLNRVNISLDTLSAVRYKNITRGGNIQDVMAGINAALEVGLKPVKINVVRLKESDENDFNEIEKFVAQKGLSIRYIHQMDLKTGEFSIVEGGDGGNCAICNRLRLMANGLIKPCLFGNKGYNVKEYGIRQAFLEALNAKPLRGVVSKSHNFYNIGG